MKKSFKLLLMGLFIIGIISFGVFYQNQIESQNQVKEQKQDTTQDKAKLGQKEEETDSQSKENNIGLGVGQIAPDFELTNLAGERVALSDFRGKYVLVNFWATWCPPCRAEMPDLNQFYLENKDDFVVLGVNLAESKNKVKEFITDGGYQYPIVLDKSRVVGSEYQVTAIPTSYFIDRQGRVQYVKRGLVTKVELNQIRDNIME
ncbi:redoxin domain-containing protein [Halanaerocella petrolearia]